MKFPASQCVPKTFPVSPQRSQYVSSKFPIHFQYVPTKFPIRSRVFSETTDLVARRQRERQGRKEGREGGERETESSCERERQRVLLCGLRCSMLRAAELEGARRSITVTNYGRLLQKFSVGRGSGRSGREGEGLI